MKNSSTSTSRTKSKESKLTARKPDQVKRMIYGTNNASANVHVKMGGKVTRRQVTS